MKTKFILHGGFAPGRADEDASEFYREILKEAPEKAAVLLVCFAKEEEKVAAATANVAARFNQNKWQKEISFRTATEASFLSQLESSDVVYLHGGKSLKLLQTLKRFPDFRNLLENKTVAGESAGANVLAEYFYSPNTDTAHEGLGFIPVKVIPHYSERYAGKLDAVGRDAELLLLPEYEYKVFFKEEA